MNKCIVCGEPTSAPIRAALNHFRLIEWGQWRYWAGNIRTFGLWDGLLGSITLSFPVINTLINWRHRKAKLTVKDGAQ